MLVYPLVVAVVAAVLHMSTADPDEQAQRIAALLQDRSKKEKEQCGSWAHDYAALHKDILSSAEPKLLVAVPHMSGLADRLIAASTALMVAILTNRAFQVGQRHPLLSFEVAFDSPHIDWTRAVDPEWLMVGNYNSSVLASKQYYAVNTINNVPLQDLIVRQDLPTIMSDAVTTFMFGNRGKTISMFENTHYAPRLKGMGLTPHTAFGCLTNFMLVPKSSIFTPLAEQFLTMADLNPDILKISIQIRVGDVTWSSPSSVEDGSASLKHFHSFFACAKEIEEFAMAEGSYKSVLWYLATESMPLRRAAAEHYGSKLITSLGATLEHSAKEGSVCTGDCKVSQEGFTTAAAEWWMLGYAEYHVVSLNSGYGRSGAFRTLNKDRVYTVPHNNKPIKCTKNSATDLENIMYDWSGI